MGSGAQCEKFYALNRGLGSGRRALCNCVSRHRARYKQPETPQHFWNIGFPTQQDQMMND